MKSFERKIIISILIAFAFISSSVIMFIINVERLKDSKKYEREAFELIHILHETYIQTLKIENESRGFLLTVKPQSEDSLNRFSSVLMKNIFKLKNFSFEDSDQYKLILRLELSVKERIEFAREVIRFRKEAGFENAQRLIYTVKGTLITNKIKHIVDLIETNQNKLLKERINNNDNIQNIVILIGAFGIVLFILLLIFVVVNIIANKRKLIRSVTEQIKLNNEIKEKSKLVAEINENLINEIEERKQIIKSLYSSEERYESLIKTSIDGFWIANKNGNIIDVNEAYCRMTGFTKEELLTKHIKDIEASETKEENHRHIEEIKKHGYDRFETLHRCADGKIINVIISVVYLQTQDIFLTFINNITQQKNIEIELKRSEEKFRLLIDTVPDAIFIHDFDGTFLFVNQICLTRLGYTREELLQKSVKDIDSPEYYDIYITNLKNFIEKGSAVVEIEHISREGKRIPTELSCCIINYDGRKVILCVARDISEQKQHQEALLKLNSNLETANRDLESGKAELQKQNEQLRQYQEEINYSREKYLKLYNFAPIGYLLISEEGTITEANISAVNLISGERSKLLNQKIKDFIFNDDQDIFCLHLNQVFKKKICSPIDIRIKKSNGTIIHVHLEFALSVTAGNIISCNLSVSDISERIKAQSELKKSEEKYRKLFQNAQVGWFRSKIDGSELLEINKKFSQIFGYLQDEIIGKPAEFFFKDIKNREIIIKELLSNGFVNDHEIDFRTSNGRIITCLVSLTMLPDKEIIEGSLVDISERKQYEEKLQISENQFRLLFESALYAIILVGPDRRIKLVNKKVEEYFGYSRSELTGEFIEKLIPDDKKDNHSQLCTGFFNNPEVSEMGKGRDLFGMRKNSTVFPVEVGLNPVLLKNEMSVMVFIVDITDRKVTEDQINIHNTSLKAVANAIVITDKNGIIIWVNPAFTILTGYSAEEAINSKTSLLKSGKQDNEFYKNLWDTILSGDVWQGELINKRKDGSLYFEEMTITPVIDKNGDIVRFIAVKLDITFRKNTEKQLLISKDEAEKANKAKSMFIANISHEIRTPMNAIIGFSEILSKQLDNKVQKGYLNSIKTSSKTLLQLINNVLDLSKIEAGKMEIVNSILNIRFLLSEMESIFILKVQEKGLKLISEVDPALPEFVELDDLRIRQMLINLISNAIKFTNEGYVKIKVISMSKGQKAKIDFYVEDTGIGMSDSDKDKIFNAFSQGDEIDTRKYGGTGLGLTITKKIVELHGGSIDFISEKGKGTTFNIRFPNVKIIESNYQNYDYSSVNPDLIIFDSAKILIVDDDESNRMVVKGYLEQYKFEMKEAENGLIALEILNNFIPDIILMDLIMPELDGRKTVKKIRQIPALKNIPVIALTASAFDNSLEKMKKHGFNGLVSKPFQQSDLVEELIKHIKYNAQNNLKTVEYDSDNVFDISKMKNPAGIYEYIEDNIIPLFNSIRIRQTNNDVHVFANIVKQLGQQFEEPLFVGLSNEISENIDSFNVSGLKKSLDKFEFIVNKLRKTNN